jgi:hypothetical protein
MAPIHNRMPVVLDEWVNPSKLIWPRCGDAEASTGGLAVAKRASPLVSGVKMTVQNCLVRCSTEEWRMQHLRD